MLGAGNFLDGSAYGIPDFHTSGTAEFHFPTERSLAVGTYEIPVGTFSFAVQPLVANSGNVGLDVQVFQCVLQTHLAEYASVAQRVCFGCVLGPKCGYGSLITCCLSVSTAKCGHSGGHVCHKDTALLHQFNQSLQCFGLHASGLGNPKHGIGDAVRCGPLAVFHIQTGKQRVGVAVVISVAHGEGVELVRLLLVFVAYVPQHAAYGLSALHHVGASCQIGGEGRHVLPPCLSTQEGASDAASETGAGEIL